MKKTHKTPAVKDKKTLRWLGLGALPLNPKGLENKIETANGYLGAV